MMTFLHDGDFSLDLIFLLIWIIISQSLFRNAIHDFYSDNLSGVNILGLLDFAVNTGADIPEELVVINDWVSCFAVMMALDMMRF